MFCPSVICCFGATWLVYVRHDLFVWDTSLLRIEHNSFIRTYYLLVCLFVCLFVGIKPERLYSASCIGRDITVKPLGAITHGQRHKPRDYQRQRHRPRTCQARVNPLQDFLSFIYIVLRESLTGFFGFWFLVCHTATQLETQSQQRCIHTRVNFEIRTFFLAFFLSFWNLGPRWKQKGILCHEGQTFFEPAYYWKR